MGFYRDYTNPYLPVAPTGQDPNLAIQAPPVGAPGEGNVLLCAVSPFSARLYVLCLLYGLQGLLLITMGKFCFRLDEQMHVGGGGMAAADVLWVAD